MIQIFYLDASVLMESVKKNQGFPVRQAEFFAANACEQPAL
ncbi:hypothetical protein B4110_2206 [Parageobacillus toebii]|uniref:PIN domain-containing protein n=1 Tax=Parageobacillus toebii TaxID=153151 RepID=A0A150N1D0_9BACL|nr:hypothetical protein B4110_2206 [Parageobacillus toebii]